MGGGRPRIGGDDDPCGEAGAVNLFGSRYGLPGAISGHQTYYFWGPGTASGSVLILLQVPLADAQQICGSVEVAAEVGHPMAMAEEHFPVLVCRNLREPLADLWPRVKHWN